MGLLRYKCSDDVDSFEKGINKLKELYDSGYDLRWSVFYANTGHKQSEFSEKVKDLSKHIRPREVEQFTNYEDLLGLIDEACFFYNNNLAGYCYKSQYDYYNEAKISIYQESEFSYRLSFDIMQLNRGSGSGVFSVGISLSDRESLIKKEAEKFKEPYRSNLINYIKNEFVPDQYYFRERSMFSEEQRSWVHIFDDYWYGECENESARSAIYKQLEYGYDRDRSRNAMKDMVELIKQSMVEEGYIIEDFDFDYGYSSIEIVNKYLGLGHKYYVKHEVNTWNESKEIDLLEDE